MLPIRLIIENYQIHKKSEIDFTKFDSALIIGTKKNNDAKSNGVGKSTILDAIEYAMFGTHQKRILDNIIRKGETKAVVIFEFLKDGIHYKIQRTRKN